MTTVILPGKTIGVLGSGQLGRMFALAARRFGYRVHVLSPEIDTPAGQVADIEVCAAYDDLDAIVAFARSVDVVTFEFENVLLSSAAMAERYAPVRPSGTVLHTTQNRIREKTFLSKNGLPVAPYAIVRSGEDLLVAVDKIGCPAVLKSANWGYDGKGQTRIALPRDAAVAWEAQGASECILESLVDFDCELSVIVARGSDGVSLTYGPIRNMHHQHILDVSVMPALVRPRIASEAVSIAREICEQLELVGVLCVEFFLTSEGVLLVNELAPRPHNSGHLTLDAHIVSQFEQQVRAVCGLPLGSTEQLRPAAMANLLGDLWASGEPDWRSVYDLHDVKLHLYGKADAEPGRKMGHLTALGTDVEMCVARVREARRVLSHIRPSEDVPFTKGKNRLDRAVNPTSGP